MASILVVDDDPLIVRLAELMLKKAGHSVLRAADGKPALDLIAAQRPDLVITDVMMPEMNGWAFVRELRSRPDGALIPVIFLTALNSPDDRIRGFHLGADDYLPKPFREEELLLRVEKTLRSAARIQDQARGALRQESASFQGTLEHLGLPSLLTLLEMERRSGELELSRPNESALLLVQNGRVVAATLNSSSATLEQRDGAECVYYLLGWAGGQFSYKRGDVAEPDRICKSTTALLMEGARRMDETSA